MNKNAEKWVEALRSGKYEQATGSLRREDKFCCLGVACDLYTQVHGDYPTGKLAAGTDPERYWYGPDHENLILPKEVAQWIGINEESNFDETIDIDGRLASQLSAINDYGASFDKIADVIESKPEGLFVD